jgi:hypothetical protein
MNGDDRSLRNDRKTILVENCVNIRAKNDSILERFFS